MRGRGSERGGVRTREGRGIRRKMNMGSGGGGGGARGKMRVQARVSTSFEGGAGETGILCVPGQTS